MESRGYINSHPFEKQLKNISPSESFPFCVCTEDGGKCKILMNFWAEKFSYLASLSLASLSNKCSQQGTSDGFHVQIDKFSSVCINYVFLSVSSRCCARVRWVRKLSTL
jgi:hypothetical protein